MVAVDAVPQPEAEREQARAHERGVAPADGQQRRDEHDIRQHNHRKRRAHGERRAGRRVHRVGRGGGVRRAAVGAALDELQRAGLWIGRHSRRGPWAGCC